MHPAASKRPAVGFIIHAFTRNYTVAAWKLLPEVQGQSLTQPSGVWNQWNIPEEAVNITAEICIYADFSICNTKFRGFIKSFSHAMGDIFFREKRSNLDRPGKFHKIGFLFFPFIFRIDCCSEQSFALCTFALKVNGLRLLKSKRVKYGNVFFLWSRRL